jgi:hypothetical protein
VVDSYINKYYPFKITVWKVLNIIELIRKPGSATSQSIIMAAYDTGFLTNYCIKKHMKKITCKKLGQLRYCLTDGIFNNWAPLQSCGCQIK